MNQQLQDIQRRLILAKEQRGRLTQIAKETSISTRTLYSTMKPDATPSAATLDSLTAYFKKLDRKFAKEATQ